MLGRAYTREVPGYLPEHDYTRVDYTRVHPGILLGYLPEYDLNHQVSYPGTPEYIIYPTEYYRAKLGRVG